MNFGVFVCGWRINRKFFTFFSSKDALVSSRTHKGGIFCFHLFFGLIFVGLKVEIQTPDTQKQCLGGRVSVA